METIDLLVDYRTALYTINAQSIYVRGVLYGLIHRTGPEYEVWYGFPLGDSEEPHGKYRLLTAARAHVETSLDRLFDSMGIPAEIRRRAAPFPKYHRYGSALYRSWEDWLPTVDTAKEPWEPQYIYEYANARPWHEGGYPAGCSKLDTVELVRLRAHLKRASVAPN
jgi:FAD/FMN-containing dehydrogenase